MGTTFLDMRPFNTLAFNHAVYLVPAYTDVAVCETKAMQVLKSSLGLRRKTIERVRIAQSPGDIFQIKARRGIVLTGLLLADNYESLNFSALLATVKKALVLTVLPSAPAFEKELAFIGDGFRAHPNGSDRNEVDVGFEMLCRALRKVGYQGVVYEPPEMQRFQSAIPMIEDECITGTHTIIGPDGQISPSIPPTLISSLKKNRV